MQESILYYDAILKETQLHLQSNQNGDGLYANQALAVKEQLIEDVPFISYMLPARHFIQYATNSQLEPICYQCFQLIVEEQICYCQSKQQYCQHQYCSKQCSDRHWITGHWLMCLDNNIGCIANIRELYNDENTYSDYAVCEIIAGLISKTVVLLNNNYSLEQASNKVFTPFHVLHAFSDMNFEKINTTLKHKKFTTLFNNCQAKLNTLITQIPDEVIQTYFNCQMVTYIYSLIAMNSILVDSKGVGIYSVISKCNHSCAPNCNVVFNNNSAILEVERSIQQGEELTISYVDDTLSKRERQKLLQESWGFLCNCLKCQGEQ